MDGSIEPVLLVVPPDGFPGAALLAVVGRLQDAGVPFVAASEDPGICHSFDGVRVTASRGFGDRRLLGLPAIVVFGDRAGFLERSGALHLLLMRASERGVILGAVGRGLLPLADAGLLRGREVATQPGIEDALQRAGAFELDAPCVTAGNLITATDDGAGVLALQLLDMAGVRSSPVELG